MAAAFRRLLLLAGRRVAVAPTQQAPRAFSTTGVPQSHRPSLESAARESVRVQNRSGYVQGAAIVLLYIGLAVGLGPYSPPKSVMREGKS